MLSLEVALGGVLLVALILYALLAGADFGGGIWDLLASGPRARAQRALIADAIGPIWEANHVWLILVIVLLFVAFSPAFAAITTALHIPLTLMLIGIVLRGSAFVFRAYGGDRDEVQNWWGQVFAMASFMTPMLLGITLGALSSGGLRVENGIVTTGFIAPWLAPFPIAVGAFALALFAFLAAVYLTVEAKQPALREDFRRRALGAAVVVGLLAWLIFWLSGEAAPEIRHGLSVAAWALPLQLVTGACAVGAIVMLWLRHFYLARVLAAVQVALIVGGWGVAQFPYLVVPDLTLFNAAAPSVTLRLVLTALAAGAITLFPSLYYLFRVFKGRDAFAILGPKSGGR